MQNQGGASTTTGGKWSKGPAADQGWGQRRPLSSTPEQTGARPKQPPVHVKPAHTVETVAAPPKATTTTMEKPKAEHPSWEAARLRKQKEAQLASASLAGNGPAKPKKIVFD